MVELRANWFQVKLELYRIATASDTTIYRDDCIKSFHSDIIISVLSLNKTGK